jgi:hypothetical protein
MGQNFAKVSCKPLYHHYEVKLDAHGISKWGVKKQIDKGLIKNSSPTLVTRNCYE